MAGWCAVASTHLHGVQLLHERLELGAGLEVGQLHLVQDALLVHAVQLQYTRTPRHREAQKGQTRDPHHAKQGEACLDLAGHADGAGLVGPVGLAAAAVAVAGGVGVAGEVDGEGGRALGARRTGIQRLHELAHAQPAPTTTHHLTHTQCFLTTPTACSTCLPAEGTPALCPDQVLHRLPADATRLLLVVIVVLAVLLLAVGLVLLHAHLAVGGCMYTPPTREAHKQHQAQAAALKVLWWREAWDLR